MREEDGLALSSRNKRLSAEEREYALNISRTFLRMRVNSARHFSSKSIRAVYQTDSSMRLLPFQFIPSRALMWCQFPRI